MGKRNERKEYEIVDRQGRKNGLIIYARMGSQRLPGKALKKIGQYPLLEHIIRRVATVSDQTQSRIIVATTISDKDDKIEMLGKSLNVDVFRGHPTDLVRRTYDIIGYWNLKTFCRINGDCPLVDPDLLSEGYHLLEQGHDMVTNILDRSFPYGVSVEWVKSSVYLRSRDWVLPEEKEHVTKHLYRNASQLNIFNIKNENDLTHLSLTVDTPEDLKKIQILFSEGNINLTYKTISDYDYII